MRTALALAFAASVAFHYAVGPWSLLPENKLEFVDTEGELSIPVDIIEDQPPEPPAPPPEPPSPAQTEAPAMAPKPKSPPGEDASVRDAGPDAGDDAGDGSAEDAGPLAHRDAAADAETALAMADAGASGLADAAVADRGDAGSPANKTHDPAALVAAASDVQAGPPLVRLFVNMEEIRKNPVGAQIGPLLSAIPQWDEFMSGTQVDPVRDTDWVYITGPSLLHTERDVILVHYS
ncbi:MAG TPA: hypothetical protein VNO21_02355, partial [Polyangiaceae bacterium]|nr:hypothetical protein [Polyangiaceae bacterium]